MAEAAVAQIEHADYCADHFIYCASVEIGAGAFEGFGLGNGVFDGFGGFVHFVAAGAEGFGYSKEDAAEAGAAHGVFGREISATEKRFTFGSEKSS